jgi:hypothetical protein
MKWNGQLRLLPVDRSSHAYLAASIVATADDFIPADLHTPHAVRVPVQHVLQSALLDIPHAQCVISRARDSNRPSI